MFATGRHRILFIAICLVGLALRLIQINGFSIWHDERVSILIANGINHYEVYPGVVESQQLQASADLSHVVAATIADNGNCLAYNTVLHFWLKAFGNSDLSARMLSVLFGVLLIPLIFLFAKKLFSDERLSLIVAFLTAIHPLFIAYAHQSRAYTMATFFTLAATWFFLEIIKGRATKKHYLLYSCCAAISLLTHYLTSYIFIAHTIVFLYSVRNLKTYVNYTLAGSLVVLVFAWWMMNGGLEGMKVLDTQNARYAQQAANFKEGDKSFAMPATAKNIVTGWFQVWLQVFGNQLQNFGLRIRQIGVMVFVPLLFVFALFFKERKNKEQLDKWVLLFVLTFFQTVYASILAVRAGHCISFQTLYASFVVPYAICLLAWGFYTLLQHSKMKIGVWIGGMLIVALMGLSWFTTYTNSNDIFPAENGHRIKAEYIEANHAVGDTIDIKSDMDLQLISIYLDHSKNYYLRVDTTVVDDTYTVERD